MRLKSLGEAKKKKKNGREKKSYQKKTSRHGRKAERRK